MKEIKIEDYVGPTTMARMKQTKWYALSRFLGEMLYSGGDVYAEGSSGSPLGYERLRAPKEGDPDYARKFIVSARLHVSGIPVHIPILGREGDTLDVQKGLRELLLECERMALKEVT